MNHASSCWSAGRSADEWLGYDATAERVIDTLLAVVADRSRPSPRFDGLKHLCLDALDVFYHQGVLLDPVLVAYDGTAGDRPRQQGHHQLAQLLHPDHPNRAPQVEAMCERVFAARATGRPLAWRLATLLGLLRAVVPHPPRRLGSPAFTVLRLAATTTPLVWLGARSTVGEAAYTALLSHLTIDSARQAQLAPGRFAVLSRGVEAHANQLTAPDCGAFALANARSFQLCTALYFSLLAAEADRLVEDSTTSTGDRRHELVRDQLVGFVHDLCTRGLTCRRPFSPSKM